MVIVTYQLPTLTKIPPPPRIATGASVTLLLVKNMDDTVPMAAPTRTSRT